jgi:hypothetical protein
LPWLWLAWLPLRRMPGLWRLLPALGTLPLVLSSRPDGFLIRARTTRAKFACGGAPEATVRIIAERAVVRENDKPLKRGGGRGVRLVLEHLAARACSHKGAEPGCWRLSGNLLLNRSTSDLCHCGNRARW